MPTVRRINSRVGLAPLPGPGARAAETPESMGAGVARAQAHLAAAQGEASAQKWGMIGRLADRATDVGLGMLTDIIRKEREAADNTAVLKADNALSEWETHALENPDTGFLRLQGESALPAIDQVMSGFDEQASQLASGLTNADQQRMFTARVLSRRDRLHANVHAHAFSEVQKHQESEFTAHLENTVNEGIRNYQKPPFFQGSLNDVVSTLQTMGPQLGITGEALKAKTLAYTTKMHVGAIQNLLANDQPDVARQWFYQATGRDENGKAIDGRESQIAADQYDQIQKAVDAGGDLLQAQKLSDQIRVAGGTLADREEKVRQALQGRARETALDLVRQDFAEEARVADEQHKALSRRFYDLADSGANLRTLMKTPGWNDLDGPVRHSLRSYLQTKAEGAAVKTNRTVLDKLMRMSDAELLNENLLKYRYALDDGDFGYFERAQKALRQPSDVTGLRTREQIFNETLQDAFIAPGTPDANRLHRELDRRAVDWQKDNGKAPDNKVLQEMLDSMIQKVVLSPATPRTGGLFGFGGTAGKPAVVKRGMDVTIQDIPQVDRDRVVAGLKKRGMPDANITPDVVVNAYLRWKRLEGGTK